METRSKFKNWIRGKEIYQIFFVRAKKSMLSRLLYGFIFILSIFSYNSLTVLVTPPPKFNELRIEEGILEKTTERGRGVPEKIIIRTSDGNTKNFVNSLPYEKSDVLQNVFNKAITVYYTKELHPFLYTYNSARAIEFNNKIIVEYNTERANKAYAISIIILKICTFLSVGMLLFIYLKNRRV